MGRRFTLIELLVVISIISILTALLLPSLSSARSKAKSISCLSNQKQLGMALSSYTNDYNGWLIVAQYKVSGYGPRNWKNQLAPYLGYSEVGYSNNFPQMLIPPFACPAWNLTLSPANMYYAGGIGWNSGVGYADDYIPAVYSRSRIQRLSKLSETVFFQDTSNCPENIIESASYYVYIRIPSWRLIAPELALSDIHQKGLNTLWGDMHASWNSQKFMIEGKSPANYTSSATNYYYMPSGTGGK